MLAHPNPNVNVNVEFDPNSRTEMRNCSSYPIFPLLNYVRHNSPVPARRSP
jgi:hypothetical protein